MLPGLPNSSSQTPAAVDRKFAFVCIAPILPLRTTLRTSAYSLLSTFELLV